MNSQCRFFSFPLPFEKNSEGPPFSDTFFDMFGQGAGGGTNHFGSTFEESHGVTARRCAGETQKDNLQRLRTKPHQMQFKSSHLQAEKKGGQ